MTPAKKKAVKPKGAKPPPAPPPPEPTGDGMKRAAWIGLVFMAIGLVGIVAHGVNDFLAKAFHWPPNLFFGLLALFGLALWYPMGAKSALGIVAESFAKVMSSWRKSDPPPPAGGG